MSKYLCGLAIVIAASLHPTMSYAQRTPSDSTSHDQTYLDFQVDRPAKLKTGRPPAYPSGLRTEGQVLVQFIVDERGRPKMDSFKVIKSSHAAMTESVQYAVSGMVFWPAEASGKKVKQLVQVPFVFAPPGR